MENSNSEPEEVYIAGMNSTSGIALETTIATTDNQTFEEEAERYSNDSKPLENRNVENADDMKTFSSEEDEEETNLHESSRILPPSVLDQASVIAERFSNNLSRRSSLALEDGKVIGYITPRLLSRSSSLMNLDNTDKSLYQVESSDFLKSHQAVLTNGEKANAEGSLGKVYSVESVFEEKDQLLGIQRESVLSFQDRQLIDKIKTYYDKAEHQDAAFSIKRRESLTYIPTGVVKNSIFKINSLPRYNNPSFTRQRSETRSSGSVCEDRQQKTSVEESTFVQKGSTDCSVLHTQPSGTSSESNVQEMQLPTSDEVFTCSTEMIKLWEEIEKEKSKSTDDGFISLPEKPRIAIESPVDPLEPLIILEEGDFGSINDKYQNRIMDNSSPGQISPCNNVSFEDQDCKTPIDDHPTFMQLASYMDANLSDNMKSRVYQLARQYSQRIKCNKPGPYRRIRDLEDDMRRGNLPSVMEEKHEEKCKLRTESSFPVYNHTISEEHSPTTPTPTSQREKSPKRLSFNSADIPDISSPIKFDCISPLSPVKTEKFDWPDVRELRSRYASTAGSSKKLSVNRSQSAPDKMTDHNVESMPEAQDKKNLKPSAYSMNGVSEETNLFDKIYIQRPNVGTEAPHNGNSGQAKEDCYYISAEATLENNKKVIIMEKIPVACDVDDTYVHIRSPTTREKISIKAVIERCKAYQDSEEYKTREDLFNSDASTVIAQDQSKPKVLTTGDIAQQNRVKNLREKFQTLNSNVGKHSEMI